jgi:uncharacterized protein (DUF1501 family)
MSKAISDRLAGPFVFETLKVHQDRAVLLVEINAPPMNLLGPELGALEVMLSAQDYDADLAERYGWINRALPAAELGDFVKSLAHRIAIFPAMGHAAVKERVNAISLPTVEYIRRDSDLFLEGTRTNEFQQLTAAALRIGFQTRAAEMNLAQLVYDMHGDTDV